MAKQYGLIIPGLQKKAAPVPQSKRETIRPSIFSEESSESEDENAPKLTMKKTAIAQPSAMERRMASKMQAKALKEDATVFQYDEIYDEIENQRDVELTKKKNEPKKSKYIERLLVVAERRKLENELRIERQVQKERELEGEEFKDKEKFVTTAYRKKLEEMRKLAEQEKHDEYLEAIGDVTKQKDLDGFYRHLYEQKLGTQKEVEKPAMQTSDGEVELTYKPIKSDKAQQKARSYRKRCATDEKEEEEDVTTSQIGGKKMHLVNNMDADSDFSIDSSTSEDEDEEEEKKEKVSEKTIKKEESKVEKEEEAIKQVDKTKVALNLDALKTTKEEEKTPVRDTVLQEVKIESTIPEPVKKEKKDIWKKRTVGEVFDAALQRYYERKAARA